MLHGKIKVNDQTVGTWKAVNKGLVFENAEGKIYNYKCTVKFTDKKGYPRAAKFKLSHSKDDGAMRLAARVINVGLLKGKKVKPHGV